MKTTTKHKAAVSFRKTFSPDGTCYKKCITIDAKTFEAFRLALQSQAALETDSYKKTFMGVPLKKDGLTIFPNLTQSNYFVEWAKKINDLEIDVKRASYEANTCLVVIP